MIKIKVDRLEGAQLDWAVAVALGWEEKTTWLENRPFVENHPLHHGFFTPTKYWSEGGKLIEQHNISLYPNYMRDGSGRFDGWIAVCGFRGSVVEGRTPLEAVLRAFVKNELGDVVEVPSIEGYNDE